MEQAAPGVWRRVTRSRAHEDAGNPVLEETVARATRERPHRATRTDRRNRRVNNDEPNSGESQRPVPELRESLVSRRARIQATLAEQLSGDPETVPLTSVQRRLFEELREVDLMIGYAETAVSRNPTPSSDDQRASIQNDRVPVQNDQDQVQNDQERVQNDQQRVLSESSRMPQNSGPTIGPRT